MWVCLGGKKLFKAEVNGEVGDHLCAGRKKGEVRHLTALLGWYYSDACADTSVTRPVVALATQIKTKIEGQSRTRHPGDTRGKCRSRDPREQAKGPHLLA